MRLSITILILAAVASPATAQHFPHYHFHSHSYFNSGFYYSPYGYGINYQYAYGFRYNNCWNSYAYGSPYWGWTPYSWSPYYARPGIVVVQPVAVIPAFAAMPNLGVMPVAAQVPVRDDDRIPAAKKADFVVVQPRRKEIPVAKKVVAERPPAKPREPLPLDPRALELLQAQQAFDRDAYGESAERLSRAIALNPDEPRAYFLLAQVQIARGEYLEAMMSIQAGLKQAPDWPDAQFRPRDLYRVQPERYDAHLLELRKAFQRKQDDPTLTFLLAYLLWFSEQKTTARQLFQQIAPRIQERAIVDHFLDSFDIAPEKS